MYVRIKIIVVSINLDKKESSCFTFLDDFLTKSITNKTADINIALKDCLSSFFEIESDWVKFKIVDVEKEDNYINIYYTCLIPQSLTIKKGKWTEIGKMNEKDIQLVFKALQQAI
jgi:hypothetical protein